MNSFSRLSNLWVRLTIRFTTCAALSRYPEGLLPPTPALAQWPLRVLLVLTEPLDATPIFPERAREQLLHGLCALDEEGAVIVDLW
jgi:hypothetical protein